mgnify:CR=1 FL=1
MAGATHATGWSRIAALVCALSGLACQRAPSVWEPPRPTGTCAGACDRYTDCADDATRRASCLQECPLVFSDPYSLAAFERMSCDDVLAFVDGGPTPAPNPADAANTSAPDAE